MRLDFRILSVDGLSLGFSLSISFMMCASYLEYLVSMGSYLPATTASKSPSMSSARKGG